MNRVIKFHETGGPNVLKAEKLPPVNPATGQVSVRMKALALNRSNALFREELMYLTQLSLLE